MELKTKLELLLELATAKKTNLESKLEKLKKEYSECYTLFIELENLGLTDDSIEFYWAKKELANLSERILYAVENLNKFGHENFTNCYSYTDVSQLTKEQKENRSPNREN
jgi:hypothetical protein